MARQDRLVVPFCTNPEAPTSSSSSSCHALEQCLICCEERPKYAAVGRCGHAEVCWVCTVRLRAVMRDFHCPVCKEELPEVAIVADPNSKRTSAKVGDDTLRDASSGLVYGSAAIRDEVERLFDYTCWQHNCCEAGRCFPTLSALEKHVEQQHQRRFCKTCLRDRKVFLFEQLLYKQADLERHHDEGDRRHVIGPGLPTSPPHARCQFCRFSLYSEDDLLEHMNRKHQLCGLCERQGRRGEYYRDYGSLSRHYEEKHFVCNHENCLRDSYRLVAFLTEDDLWMHELKEHTNAKNAPQKTRKHGTRLNIQFGTSSYRDEMEERRRTTQSAGSRQSRPGATGAASGTDAWTGGVRFMWPRGKPAAGPKSDEFGDSFGDAAEHDEDRYPPRPVPKGRANRVTNAVSVPAKASKGAAASSSSQGGIATKTVASHGPVAEEHRVLARLLAMALQRIEQTGLDVIAGLEQEEYRERNRRFKRDLQAELGERELRSFKECSAQFRQAFANAPASPKAKDAGMTYARRVLEVFATAKAKSGEFVAAELLSDLVLLLPDTEPRKLLRSQLSALQLEEAALGEVVQVPLKTAGSLHPRTQSSASPAGLETSAPPMPQKLQALQASCCSSGDGRPPNFLQALDAVMRILTEGSQGQSKVKAQALRQQVKRLDAQQAESLQCMQQHLVAAGAADLDFGPMERLMSLRPLLSLKMQGVAGAGAGAAADRARCWREWKDAAAAAIQRLGQDEGLAVQLYVSLCLQQGTEHVAPASTKAPVVSAAWERSQQASPDQGDFPALPCSEPAARPESICLGAPSGGRGRMGGRRKGQPLNAWG
eukprot:TRINITY_DN104332_c0_g1_i1.p1 TRINITY_DN104332_c0_g1~~TRINITY_DN104332_c0_g1_i1.p1  ORF type:complete len:824 (+),score=158.94 TRINITY_DN104332_c0_g1_i1:64-2535(+)